MSQAALPGHSSLPDPSARSVARPRLSEALDRATRRRLTMVSAGPGWGKTTAVAQWARMRRDVDVVWLTLQERDNDPTLFWADLAAALSRIPSLPPDHPLRRNAASQAAPEELTRLLGQQLREGLARGLVLILDDVHVVDNSVVLEGLERLAESGPSTLRLVLVSRVDPPMLGHRLRLDDEVSVLTAAELAFDSTEAMALAARQGLPHDPALIDDALQRTDGWPAGVRLALLHLEQHPESGLRGFAGDDRSVSDYLAAEVLHGLDDETAAFMTRISITALTCADLASAITGEARAESLIAEMERRNLFITAIGDDRTWFRYHPLLRDVLTQRFRHEDPVGYRQAHVAAAQWLARHSDPMAALEHCVAAGAWDLFGRVFTTSAAGAIVGARRSSLMHTLRTVPFDTLPDSRWASLATAAMAFVAGRYEAVTHQLTLAKAAPEPADAAERVACAAMIELFQWIVTRNTGELEASRRHAHAALDQLDTVDKPFPAWHSYGLMALNASGVGALWCADLDEARRLLEQVDQSAPPDIDVAMLNARSHLVLCDVLDGRLDDAVARGTALAAQAAAQGWSSLLQARPTYTALAAAHVLRGHHELADPMLATAQAALVGGEEPAQTLLQHLLRTESALLAGRPQAATVAFDQAVRSARTWQPMPWLLDEMRRVEVDLLSLVPDAPAAGQPADAPPTGPASLTAHSTAARRTLLSGDAPGALAQAHAASSSAAGAASLPVLDQRALVELALVEAVASDQLRREHEALSACRRAIALAEPTGLAAPFLLAGFARMPRLLVRARETSAAPPEMLGSLLGRLGEHRQPANEPAPLLQPLTQRELTLLTLLPSVRTNPELADDLFVSVNTVKSHLKSLYRKLDVNNRRQAVRRARDLGLIP